MEAPLRKANRTAESLGKVTYVTKPNTSNLIAGIIISLLLFGGGLSLSAYMLRQLFFHGGNRPQTTTDSLAMVGMAVFGVALAIGGVFLFRWAKSMFGFRLSVCHDGFYFIRGGVESVFAWDDIVQVRETVLHEKLPLAKGAARKLMPTKTSRSYAVVRCDGKEFYFDDNVIERTSLLAGPLSSAAKKTGFAWETNEEKG
ncbi:MAG: hypothetical protein U1E05_08215 [Patescibacteria group bacterium]|nr:hypothetical protein [Patescibacteria group bacterium]